jgi:hypothetical protein
MCFTSLMSVLIYLIDIKQLKKRDLSPYFSVHLYMHGPKNHLVVYIETF